MKTIQKRVKIYLNKEMEEIYNYCVGRDEGIGQGIVRYLDYQYSYKYLIFQKKKGKKPQEFQIDEEVLSQESLSYDYHKKQRLLINLLKELEDEYNYLSNWIQKNSDGEENKKSNNYSLKNLNYENVKNEYQDKLKKYQQDNPEYKKLNYEVEEEDDEEDENEDSKANRGNSEPDPEHPGYTKDGDIIW